MSDKNAVLIVDDMPENAALLIECLSEAKFKVLVAPDGESAVEQTHYAHPDIILLDVMMPGIDGFETCRRLKADKETREIPVIFMTALSDTVDKVKGFEAGAVDYVTKPFQQEEVLARLNTHLTIRNLQKSLRAEITEREATEEALRESQERLARILTTAMDAIITIDEQNQIVLFNQASEKVFRCPAVEALNRSFEPFLTDSFRKLLAEYVRSCEENRESVCHIWAPQGVTALRADGEAFPIEGTVSFVEVRGQKLYTIILRDINEKIRAESRIQKLQLENIYFQEEIKSEYNFEELIGQCPEFRKVIENVKQVAETDTSVLILGETGTGKELIARAIHNQSRRKERPFIKVNCAALPAGLVESEFFGHEKGAFTGAINRKPGRFELADGGSIFLDEIGDVPLDVQVKLLRVLQEQEFERVGGTETKKVNVRLIAATNRDLAGDVQNKSFRADLYYRLNVFPVLVPPLRKRKADIPLLVHHFTQKFAAKLSKKMTAIDEATMSLLSEYEWPGNIRELSNIIERALILCKGKILKIDREVFFSVVQETTNEEDSYTLEEVERRHILKVLQQTQWVINGSNGAAELLGLHPNTLRNRMNKLGIRRQDHRIS